jgi:hypothetical protein
MKKMVFILFIVVQSLQAQVEIKLSDKATNHAISYANVWKEKSLYKTSDSIGIFVVDSKDIGNSFKITCIGYNDTIVKMSQEIMLQPILIALDEVTIVKRKFEKKLKLGKANRGNNIYGVQWDSKIAMTAKYFPNQNAKSSYLSKISFFATASTTNRLISVQVYSANGNGSPAEIMNTENIVCKLKKGTHAIEIDVNHLNIQFPSNGIFIIIQHPLLEQNKNFDKKSTNPNAFVYEPFISIITTDVYKDSWFFNNGVWNKSEKYSVAMRLEISD